MTIEDGSDDNGLFIDLKGPVSFSIGFEVRLVEAHRRQNTFEAKSTGVFRYGRTVLELNSIPSGTYAIQPMTFQPGQDGPFLIQIESTASIKCKRVQ